jgi:hypothetical protein
MRARGSAVVVRGTAVETARPARRRPAAVGCGEGGRERGGTRHERPAVPERSTFRRVAVFVPFR